MAISTNPKPAIYRNLYENTGPDDLTFFAISRVVAVTLENNSGQISWQSDTNWAISGKHATQKWQI